MIGDQVWRKRLLRLYLVLALPAFGALLALAAFYPYLPLDLTVTVAVQAYDAEGFLTLMRWVSWPGFGPQTYFITGAVGLGLLLAGRRWEAGAAALAASSSGAGLVIKVLVQRPRPTPDLVQVVDLLTSYSFPSGHVLFYTAFYGFLFYLVYYQLRPSPWRALLLWLLGGLIALVGVSRIALGHHWFSDVLAAYLLGSVWLAATIWVYRWGRATRK